MTVLVDINVPRWKASRDVAARLAEKLPGVAVHAYEDGFPEAEIEVVATSRLREGLCARLPNLKLVQKMGAGVETMLHSGELPEGVRVTRLKAESQAQDMAEWALGWVMAMHRELPTYQRMQAERQWHDAPPARIAPRRCAAVLGLGAIGGRTAEMLRAVGFRTLGWSRTPKAMEGVDCRHGVDALDGILGEADHVVCVLPSTAETVDLFDAARLGTMKAGATLYNMGRGDLIDEDALIAALDVGRPGRAVLDVQRVEPLPKDSALWTHPGVTITPHASGRYIGGSLETTAENVMALREGRALLHEVDRARGY